MCLSEVSPFINTKMELMRPGYSAKYCCLQLLPLRWASVYSSSVRRL
jgi:hypothetical protein